MRLPAAFLEYSDIQHVYYVNGKEMPSVTQILDAGGLISPFCKDEEARARGSRVHEYTATDDVKRLDVRSVPKRLRSYLWAWRSFRSITGFRPMLIEERVDSIEYGYSGRFDRLGICDNKPLPILLDIKTSKTGAVPDYARLQLAAYSLAFDPTKAFERMAVVLKPDGTFNLKSYPVAQHFIDRAEWLALVHRVKEVASGNV